MKVFTINGLHCAVCAKKIESAVNNMEEVKSARLDFVSQKLSVDSDFETSALLGKINEIADRIKPGIVMSEKAPKRPEKDREHGKETSSKIKSALVIAGFALFVVALISSFAISVKLWFYIAAYLLIGWKILLTSAKNILKGEVFDENFLMSIATIGAFAIGEYPEAVAVMLFYRIGMFFEDMAVAKSRKSISDLMDIRPDYANLKKGDEILKVSPEEVKAGDIILVKPGEKIPLDGSVISGRSAVDVSALTGESVPYDAQEGSEVLSGSINKNGLLSIKVTKIFSESAVSKILDLVENASANKSHTESFITKFAKYYTPAVVGAAALVAVLPPLFISAAAFSDWVYRALVFLVVSCPCALVVSIPLSFFGGIGGASKNGILIKGSNYLEALNYADTFIFDKTGTLTRGVFSVSKIANESWLGKDEFLKYAAYAESFSGHPIAVSIRKAYGANIDQKVISFYEDYAGFGVSAMINGKAVLAGNYAFLQNKVDGLKESSETGTIVYLSVNGKYAGYIVVADEIKADSKKTIAGLKKAGIKKIYMLTGDKKEVGEYVAGELGIDEVYTDLLPDRKIAKVEEIKQNKKTKGKVVFVGDGINDAPVLAGADIGIAMGGLGSDAAIEAADIVLMTDEPSKTVAALKIAAKTKSIVWQNIIFALGVKAAVLLLAVLGMASMWSAVFADVGVTFIAVLNSIRALKVNNDITEKH